MNEIKETPERWSKFEKKEYTFENLKKFFSENHIYKKDYIEDEKKTINGKREHYRNSMFGWDLKSNIPENKTEEDKQNGEEVYIDADTGEEIHF